MKWQNPYDPLVDNRFRGYNEMMAKREGIDSENRNNCAKCHRPRGNHLTEYALKQNPYACRFVSKY